MYTVKRVAELAGVSVRALHHYDAISLLRPAHTGTNGYRYYDRENLLRLQQILIHRELGIPLAEIADILDDPGFDRLEALMKQRERIAGETQRLSGMLRTIDRTIAELKGDRAMKDADLYTGIVDPKKQAEYERWLVDTYGPDMADRIAQSKAVMASQPEGAMQQQMAELEPIERGLAEAMQRGIAADDPVNDALIEAHRAWVGKMWDKPCPPQAYAGLADMYLAHPDFAARYEAIAPGFTIWLTEAMKSWAARQG
ncbi:MerR family transcriptional regulator [Pelagibacterium limicola]|uniref:MerR family transcriptional regulator n=1 Tax=Pelagibacterium limicola TaxID=2791022 RepID=UPI0018AF6D77|nr:MerR family transcriptional regulator [Pelagibacterium limicola]